jgi:hypothetical protein
MTTIQQIAAQFADIKPRPYSLVRAILEIEAKIGKPLMSCQFEDGSGFSFNYQILGEVGSKWNYIRL